MGLHERGRMGRRSRMLSVMAERRERVEVCQRCSVIKRLLLQPALLLYITKLARAVGGWRVLEQSGDWQPP